MLLDTGDETNPDAWRMKNETMLKGDDGDVEDVGKSDGRVLIFSILIFNAIIF